MKMNPWQVTTDPKSLRRLGKLGEELGELQAVVGRIVIQGINEIDPSSGETNRQRLQKEIADVIAQCTVTTEELKLDGDMMNIRVIEKMRQMAEWEAHFNEPMQPEQKCGRCSGTKWVTHHDREGEEYQTPCPCCSATRIQ